MCVPQAEPGYEDFRMSLIRSFIVLLPLTVAVPTRAADAPDFAPLAKEYDAQTHPLLKQFCIDCHSTADPEGELDLERFATLKDVRHAPTAWQKVAEMLDNGEMPPKDADQLSPDQRKQLRGWVQRYLDTEARASAGDPGPVVLRRLSNAEYTYTIRDLTGVPLDPAREFPADGAAGEGFTNAGAALAMSPALLQKYFDAGKDVAGHAVLLPHGVRFSASNTRRDWTEEALAGIHSIYDRYTDNAGASQVNLQGIVFDTNGGGRLPVEAYLAATLVERDALRSGSKSIAAVARERKLSEKYLGRLWKLMNAPEPAVGKRTPSMLLDNLRAHWRTAKPEDATEITNEIVRWQRSLFRFASIGHIGKVGGPKAWMETISPLASRQELKLKVPADVPGDEFVLYLVTSDAGDGKEHDFAVWERPRLVAPGRPELLLKDVRAVTHALRTKRQRLFAGAAKSLEAASEAGALQGTVDVPSLAKKHSVDADALAAWLDYLGIGASGPARIGAPITSRAENSAGYDFVKGWVGDNALSIVANSSDQLVRIPGNLKPHSVAVHPAPTLQVAAGWRCVEAATVAISAEIQHAHPECGNGVTWAIELRRGSTQQRLAAGIAHGAAINKAGPIEKIAVQPGDVVALVIGPRDANHSCDLTSIDLTLNDGKREWNLARDVSPDILAGNPHADGFGNKDVWHFFSEPASGDVGHVIPAGSLLARWQSAGSPDEKRKLAGEVQQLLENGAGSLPPESPDVALYAQLTSLGGPLFSAALQSLAADPSAAQASSADSKIGLDPALFGKHPDGSPIEPASLCIQAPAVIEVRLPADLVRGAEFVSGASLHAPTGSEGSVQVHVLDTKPDAASGLLPSAVNETNVAGAWTSNNRRTSHSTPILVADDSAARRQLETAFEDFRQMFPAALCYSKIVPVDEVVTLTLFYREDEPLRRLMLNDAETADLNRLWDELHFVSQDRLSLVDGFEQLMEFATQDADPKVFEPMRKPIYDAAAAFRQQMLDAEPSHLDAVIEFAGRAYRRPLSEHEGQELRALYQELRNDELPHADAIRFLIARVCVSPTFLYRLEQAPSGTAPAPVSDFELASRLSYFLWSSAPDAELTRVAAEGRLHEPDVLAAQAQRMLKDARTRRLGTEFACQWLHIYDFNTLDEKSERHFPEFAELKGDMYEEAIRFFTDLFQTDGSVMSIFDADHTFVNERLAKFYGIPGITGEEWRRVDGMKQYGRGGILGLSSILAQQSGASRTSPILRGTWTSEVILGEKLPKPPPNVPLLPEDEATEELTVRQLVEKHVSDERCATCHKRIDPFGFALERFDAIGRHRDKDLAGRDIDTHSKVLDGTELDGLEGLRTYLTTNRRDTILRQFCKKLLGYSLGRGLQLSDEPLLEEMQQQLKKNDFRFSVAVETIVRSQQFREIRGKDTQVADTP
jgi:hypothetical protein